MPNYGPEVSRTLPIGNTSYLGTVHLKLKPSIDAEHNLDTDLMDFNSAKRLKALIFSGVTNVRAANRPKVLIPTLDPDMLVGGKKPNEFAIQNFEAVVNGYVIQVRNSKVNGGNFDDDDYLSIELPAAPAPSTMFRQDFIFLEVWRSLIKPNPSITHKPDATHVYYDGNVQYAGTNPLEDLIDPTINATTSYRIQLQYRLRVVEGVNFAVHPEGLTDTIVSAQGGANAPNSAWKYTSVPEDPGLFVAGDGTLAAQAALGNVDGHVFAIPVCKIHRRNSSAYSIMNPNGSSSDIVTDAVSDRPDGLFYDEVAIRDIIDLRHQVQTDLSNSDLLEHNFDALLRRQLNTEFGRDTQIDNQIQGLEMLTIDGYAVADMPNVYNLPFDPDGLRRDYSEESRVHQALYTFTTATDITTGPVRYNKVLRRITVIIDQATIQSNPKIYTDGTERLDAIPGGWSPAVPGSTTSGILDPAYDAATTVPITIRLQLAYNPSGHRFIATNYYSVNNARALNPEQLGFVVNPTTFAQTRNVPVTGGVVGVANKATDYPIITVGTDGTITYPSAASGSSLSFQSYTRVYEYHLVGNNTEYYTIPNEIDDVVVCGVQRVYISPIVGIAFAPVEPDTVIRNADGSFTVEMPAGYTNTTVIKFVLILQKTATVLDKSTKGLREIMEIRWVEKTVSAVTNTVTFEVPNQPYGMSSYVDFTGVSKFFVYYQGTRVSLPNASVQNSLNKITLTFPDPVAAGTLIRFYILAAYAPTLVDKLQLSYDRLVYQGLSDFRPLQNARIMAIGKHPLVHSIGTYRDTDVRNKEIFAISETLPLAYGKLDSDLQNDSLSLSNTQFSSFKMLRIPYQLTHDYRLTSLGKLPEIGDIIVLKDVSTIPARGIADKAIHLQNRLQDVNYPMEYITPLMDADDTHQVVQYYLIQTQVTHELMMLVITYTNSTTGNQLVKVSPSETGVAYDLFRLHGKPILK